MADSEVEFRVREGTPQDAKAILDMIKELCEYIKEPLSQVETTEKDLIKDGLEQNKFFHCLVAEKNTTTTEDEENMGEPEPTLVGYALYYFGYSTWKGKILYLEDLYVKPELRGKGIGTDMLKRLGEISKERSCARMMWICLDWNTSAKDFYSKIGAEEQNQWRMFCFTKENIEKFKNM